VNLLLGGLITLAVTAVVQILIIPWVQRRNRLRERWEKDVIEFVNLLEVDLTRVLRSARLAALEPYSIAQVLRDLEPGEGADRLREQFKPAVTQARPDHETLADLTSHARLLVRRVRLVRPRAPFWRRLLTSVLALHFYAGTLDPSRLSLDPGYDLDAYYNGFATVEGRGQEALDLVRQVSDRMKPPPGRMKGFARRKVGAIHKRLTRKQVGQQPAKERA
jgi:hypothetical protein